MIIEFVGPSASGKSTIIQNLKESCKLDLIYQSDINLSTFYNSDLIYKFKNNN